MGSRGSVIPFFLKFAKANTYLPITDEQMSRFNITLEQGVEMVKWSLKNALGGEIFVPKLPSYRVTDVAKAIAPSLQREIVGIRPGEKIHEQMITASDSHCCFDLNNYYAIMPSDGLLKCKYDENSIALTKVPEGFSYDSGTNPDFLTVEEIRDLIIQHVDPSFIPL